MNCVACGKLGVVHTCARCGGCLCDRPPCRQPTLIAGRAECTNQVECRTRQRGQKRVAAGHWQQSETEVGDE